MINLEKNKWEKCRPLAPFKKTCPCTILPSPFNFSDPPPPQSEFAPPTFKKRERVNYGVGCVCACVSVYVFEWVSTQLHVVQMSCKHLKTI